MQALSGYPAEDLGEAEMTESDMAGSETAEPEAEPTAAMEPFAAALDDPETGFALTAAQVAADAQRGRTAGQQVGTGPCD